ncbi:enoyl-CoA hydratase/isomerase family protein [Brucella sp. 21LCYQ03]|nr:enoyl-CoA hydratase/isomerase family protein [Brucella sp. 21LCYQ03]
MQNYESLTISRRGRITTVALNRPQVRNATDATLHRELAKIFYDLDSDRETDVIILTGNGSAFCAGGDVEYMQNLVREQAFYDCIIPEAKRIVGSILDCRKPIIAKLNGHATGFGATLALFCDVVFGNRAAKIGDPHVLVGLTAGDGSSVIWPQLIGHARAKEYLMTGDLITMAKAAEIGLINHALPLEDLDSAVQAFADKLARLPQLAIQTTKIAVNISLKQLVASILDASLAYEVISSEREPHRKAVEEFIRGGPL